MINYLSSESYRLFRKKSLYLTGAFYLFVSVIILIFLKSTNEDFLNSSSVFYLSSLCVNTVLSLFIVVLFSSFLTGKDNSIIKNSVSFGISRNTIFLGKLLISLGIFLLLFALSVILTMVLGENLFSTDPRVLSDFQLSTLNLLPLIISAFVIGHVLSMMQIGQIVIVLILLFSYSLAGEILHSIFSIFMKEEPISRYFPSNLLAETGSNFFQRNASFMIENWLVSGLVIAIALFIGMKVFRTKEI